MINQNFVANQPLQITPIFNVQSAYMLFPASTTYTALHAASDNQYVSNYLKSFNMRLGENYIPSREIILNASQLQDNSELYYHFRRTLHKSEIDNYVPSIDFGTFYIAETYYIYAIYSRNK